MMGVVEFYCVSYNNCRQFGGGMKERKNWTAEEDKVLKFLIEERKMSKWSQISQVMEKEFQLGGRNGKQCRQRYHNHLDKNISNEEWTLQEENKLFDMQDQVGNKWALISTHLPGRTDNCVKNHFYSKLRKSLRKINKKIHKHLKREYKDIKTSTLYRIIETMENKYRPGCNTPQQTYELCRKIKNQLRLYQDQPNNFQDQQQQLKFIRNILEDISLFDQDIKKSAKKTNLKTSGKLEEEQYSPRCKSSQSNILSTKSAYDDDESSYSNSDLFSSSSFDHRSFCSNRSQRKLKTEKIVKSHSIQSQSQEEDSDPENDHLLYKSAQLKKDQKSNFLSNSLQLPVLGQSLTIKKQVQVEYKESSSSKEGSRRSSGSERGQNENQMFITYMMGQQPFEMRLLSPKKPTIEQRIQMSKQQDQLFYGQSMQIQSDILIHNFSGLGINQIPKLGHSMDL